MTTTPDSPLAAIVGIGATEFSKASGRSEMQLAAEASRQAIDDAGIDPSEIDGMVSYTMDVNDEQHLARTLGIPELRWLSRTQPPGGMGTNQVLRHAAAAVQAGFAKNVLIYRAFNERSGTRFGQPTRGAVRPTHNVRLPFGLDTPAKIFSLYFHRYMQNFGLTNEDFGHYPVVARRHAATNPAAWFYERPITLDDHQASRWIVDPVLRLFDCCQESDGGCAIVVTSADRAKDTRGTPVLIRSMSETFASAGVDILPDYEELRDPAGHVNATAWEGLGVGPEDIDVAMVYDHFSPIVPMRLERFGFCEPGEGTAFIADGNIDLDGSLPVNPHGGLIGEAYIHGINNILEAVRQIRGEAANQVPDVERVANITSGIVVLEKYG